MSVAVKTLPEICGVMDHNTSPPLVLVKETVAVVQVTDDEHGIAIQSPPGLLPSMVMHPEEEQNGVVVYVTVQQYVPVAEYGQILLLICWGVPFTSHTYDALG